LVCLVAFAGFLQCDQLIKLKRPISYQFFKTTEQFR
jgi:hypothetical protein